MKKIEKQNISITLVEKKITVVIKRRQMIVISMKTKVMKKLVLIIIKKATIHRNVFKSIATCDIFPTCSLGTNQGIESLIVRDAR